MRFLPIIVVLLVEGLFAQTPEVFTPMQIPKEAIHIDRKHIAIPLANQARKGLLLLESLGAGKDFCVVPSHQAKALAGEAYTEIEGMKTLLVKWRFLEPAGADSVHRVSSDAPSLFLAEKVLYVSSSGIDIGNAGKLADGVLIVQLADLPSQVVFKLHKMGW